MRWTFIFPRSDFVTIETTVSFKQPMPQDGSKLVGKVA